MIDENDPKIAEQIPLNQALLLALVEITPDAWPASELHLKWNDELTYYEHTIVGPDAASVVASSELLAAAEALSAHGRKFALPWVSAVFTVRRAADGNWQAGASFQQRVPASTSAPSPTGNGLE